MVRAALRRAALRACAQGAGCRACRRACACMAPAACKLISFSARCTMPFAALRAALIQDLILLIRSALIICHPHLLSSHVISWSSNSAQRAVPPSSTTAPYPCSGHGGGLPSAVTWTGTGASARWPSPSIPQFSQHGTSSHHVMSISARGGGSATANLAMARAGRPGAAAGVKSRARAGGRRGLFFRVLDSRRRRRQRQQRGHAHPVPPKRARQPARLLRRAGTRAAASSSRRARGGAVPAAQTSLMPRALARCICCAACSPCCGQPP